jgi:hypothetical protein
MCDPTAGSALLGLTLGGQIYQGEKSRKAMERAQRQQSREADQAFNRANPKRPDVAAALARTAMAARGGASSTMSTGPRGVDPNALTLGRASLLGNG